MFPDNPNPDRSLIAFSGFPVPSKAVQAFPGFPTIGRIQAVDLFNYLDGWNQTQIYEISIDNSLIDADLSNFPLLIKLEVPLAAKSIIVDITDNWGDPSYVGLRSIDLYKDGELLSIVQADYTAYATTEISANFASEFVYDTTLTKIDVGTDAAWLSSSVAAGANQRLIVVFDDVPDFDSMVINNYHQGGSETDRGSKNVVITISSDVITDTTFEASILNSEVIYTGELAEHITSNAQDDIDLDDVRTPSPVDYSEFFNTLTKSSTGEVLLLHSDTIDGSTTFVDSSASEHTITDVGVVDHSTDYNYFGNTSINIGAGADYLLVPASSDFDFGTDDFTIDFWLWKTSYAGTDYAMDIGSNTYYIRFNANVFEIRTTVPGAVLIVSASTPTISTWHHFAVTRSGDTWRIFIDGVVVDSATYTTAWGNSTSDLTIGDYGGHTSFGLDGYLDEFRIVKGTAIWTDDFTPPTIQYPYYIISEIVQKIAVADASGNQLYVEVQEWDGVNKICLLWVNVPTVTASADTKLYLYYDVEYDPGNNVTAKSVILDIADDHGFATYMAVRSIEFFYQGTLIDVLTADITGYATSTYVGYTPEMAFDTSFIKTGTQADTQWLSGSGSITNQRLICVFDVPIIFDSIVINNAHHNGTTYNAGLNNVKIYYSTDSITSTTYGAAIENSELIFDGIFTEHIAVDQEHSQVVYVVTPTDEQTDATFLLSSDDTDGAILFHDTSFTGIPLTVVGDTHHEVDSAKFGQSAIYFDGVSDSLSSPTSDHFDFSGGVDFTIDMWVNYTVNAVTGVGLLGTMPNNTYGFGLCVQGSSYAEGQIGLFTAGAWRIQTSNTITAGTWHHIALVGLDGVIKVYIDGIADVNTYTGEMAIGGTDLSIGNMYSTPSASWHMKGYLDEIHTINGTALWTDDFIPPIAPYAFNNIYLTGIVGSISGMKVWDDNFKIVMHMNQDPSGGTDCILDSTQYNNHGTPVGTMLTEDLVDGHIHKAIDFDGLNDYLQIDDSGILDISGDFDGTLEAIVTSDDVAPLQVQFVLGAAVAGQSFGMYMYLSDLVLAFNDGVGWTSDGSILSNDTMHMLAVSKLAGAMSSTTCKLYLDGTDVPGSGSTTTPNVTPLADAFISKWTNASGYISGLCSELRLSKVVRSAAWLKATNSSNRNLLLTITKKV